VKTAKIEVIRTKISNANVSVSKISGIILRVEILPDT
jgi:hypothetical protein